MEWYDRARRLMDAGGINAAELARRAGIHEKTIYKYLDGKVDQPRGDTLSRIARVLSVSDQYLRFGEPTSIVTELARVPLLRLADMGKLIEGQDPKTAWDGETVVAIPKGELHDGDFAVLIETDAGAPEFRPGEVIICSPNAEVTPGRFVVAVSINLKQAFFGRYLPQTIGSPNGGFHLDPPNQDYPDVLINSDNPGFVVARATRHIRHI